MPESSGWTRDQLLIALRLYMRTPFGRLHGRNPQIIELSDKIGRTPNALAMKACNFASLDPAFRASNRKGLSGAKRRRPRALERICRQRRATGGRSRGSLRPHRAARRRRRPCPGATAARRNRRPANHPRAACAIFLPRRRPHVLRRPLRDQRPGRSRVVVGQPHHPLEPIDRTPRRSHQWVMPQRPLRSSL
jgi:hypothetical protein